jgi:hypothetical protein
VIRTLRSVYSCLRYLLWRGGSASGGCSTCSILRYACPILGRLSLDLGVGMDWKASRCVPSVPLSLAYIVMRGHIVLKTIITRCFVWGNLNPVLGDDFCWALSEQQIPIFYITNNECNSLPYAVWYVFETRLYRFSIAFGRCRVVIPFKWLKGMHKKYLAAILGLNVFYIFI